MTSSTSQLQISIAGENAYLKIIGRANVHLSVAFKQCLQTLHDKGMSHFCLVLDECIIMDSTFVGILAGFCRHQAEDAAARGSEPEKVILYSPNQRVTDLIENLGIGEFFVVADSAGHTFEFEEVQVDKGVERNEFTRHCLEAHRNLMELNPDNIPKFKDVAAFLEGELKSGNPS